MKFATVENKKVEATSGAKGVCVGCGSELIPKCGEIRVKHWSHKSTRHCDPWWENETEWHRAWKNQFPMEWQEVVHRAENGEKHIADVKTEQGWVLEFQHSSIKPDERRARNAFYKPKLIWIIDGTRRKRDEPKFSEVWESGDQVKVNFPLRTVVSDDCALIREWADTDAPVFFDFGESVPLWCLLPGSVNGKAFIGTFFRKGFLEFHRPGATQMGKDFTGLMKTLREIVSLVNSRGNVLSRPNRQSQMGNFQRHLTRLNRSRRRL